MNGFPRQNKVFGGLEIVSAFGRAPKFAHCDEKRGVAKNCTLFWLRFVANEEDAVRALPEDEYYGSNFAKVLLVIHRLYEQDYVRPDYIDGVSSKDLNDDTLS